MGKKNRNRAQQDVPQDPQGTAYVISDLTVLNALVLQHSVENVHAALLNELESKLICLEEEHQAVREGLS